MKCSGDEWDHCRVEKMGCYGCYYNDIDIEKAKKIIKNSYVMSTKHCLDDENQQLKQALEILIQSIEKLEKENKALKKESQKNKTTEDNELKKILESKNKIKVLNFKGGI